MPYTLTITNISQDKAVELVEEMGGGEVAFSSESGKPINPDLPVRKMVAYPTTESVATIQSTQ